MLTQCDVWGVAQICVTDGIFEYNFYSCVIQSHTKNQTETHR